MSLYMNLHHLLRFGCVTGVPSLLPFSTGEYLAKVTAVQMVSCLRIEIKEQLFARVKRFAMVVRLGFSGTLYRTDSIMHSKPVLPKPIKLWITTIYYVLPVLTNLCFLRREQRRRTTRIATQLYCIVGCAYLGIPKYSGKIAILR